MRICYYVTAHGYGHGVRTSAVCNRFSPSIELVFRTALPRRFFEEEIGRPFEYSGARFDCGCLQSDSVTVDVPATTAEYARIADRNATMLESEVRWLRDNRIDGIVSDIPPFPLEAAAAAGIPGVLATNFTWYDIYEEYAGRCPEFLPYLDAMRAQYAKAGLLLEAEPALPMPYCARRRPVPVIGRKGRPVRDAIVRAFGLDPQKHLGLIYTGTFGMDRAPWGRLEDFAGWEFLGVLPLSAEPRNYHTVPKTRFRYQDLSASVDAVISKIGYGTYAESVLHGVPLIYLPRADFAEFPALERAVAAWGHGHRLEAGEFNALRWEGALDSAVRGPRPEPCPDEGAAMAAREIERYVAPTGS